MPPGTGMGMYRALPMTRSPGRTRSGNLGIPPSVPTGTVRRHGSGAVLFLLLLAGLGTFALFSSEEARAATLYVGGPGPGNYTTIQAAVDAASPGDTVFVFNGTYYGDVTVSKTLSLVGQDMATTVIVGGVLGTPIRVTADWVNITGFTVRDESGYQPGRIDCWIVHHGEISGNDAGEIWVYNSVGVTVSGNRGGFVEVYRSSDIAIRGNNLSGSAGRSNFGVIDLYASTNVTITGNILDGGIYLFSYQFLDPAASDLPYFNTHTITPDNLVNGKPVYYYKDLSGLVVPDVPTGELIVVNSTDVQVSNLMGVGAGIWIGFVDRITISGSEASSIYSFHSSAVTVASSYADGIGFLNTTDAAVVDSSVGLDPSWWPSISIDGFSSFITLIGNDLGSGVSISYSWNVAIVENRVPADITIEDSSDVAIVRNTIQGYLYWGVWLRNTAVTTVHHNSFYEGGYGTAADDGPENLWDDGYPSGGNYWYDYAGIDLFSGPNQDVPGGDGIGDTPYVIDADSADRYPLMRPVDMAPPTVAVTSHTNGQWVSTSTPSLEGTAADTGGSGLSRVEVSCDDGTTWGLATGTAVWTYAECTLEPLSNIVRARAFDNASRESAHAVLTLHYDPNPSTVAIDSPVDGAWLNTAAVNVSGTAADAESGLDRVEISCNNGLTWRIANGTTSWTAGCAGLLEGPNVFMARSFDRVGWGSEPALLTVNVDLTPPATQLGIGYPNYTVGGAFVTTSTPFVLAGTDAGVFPSGIDRTEYRLDGNPWNSYLTPFTIATEGPHAIAFRSVDAAGNAEGIQSVDLVVDDTPPASTLTLGSPNYLVGGTFVTSATPLSASAADGGTPPVGVAVTEFRVDGAAWRPYLAPFGLSGEGVHTVEVRSRDWLGLEEAYVPVAITVDDSPPATTISPDTGPHTTDTRFALLAVDAGSGVAITEYRVDGGSWLPYSGPFPVPSGSHQISYRSVDHLGNVEVERTLDVRVGLALAPVTVLLFGEPSHFASAVYVKSTTPLDFFATDRSGLGLRSTTYRIDGRAWINYTAMGSFTLGGEGPHLLQWNSVDFAGNLEDTHDETVWVDDTPPATTISPTEGPFTTDAVFALAATDAASGVAYTEYQIDGDPWAAYSVPFPLPPGSHRIAHRSVDNLGNLEAERTLDVRVGFALAPSTALIVGDPNHQAQTPPVLYVTSATPLRLSALDRSTVGLAETLYRMDDGPYGPSTAMESFFLYGEGEHRIEWYSVDLAGNVEASKNQTLRVDDTPPFATLTIGEAQAGDSPVIVTSSTRFTLDAIDGGVMPVGLDSIRYRIDLGPWMPYTTPFTIPLADGAIQLEYSATDLLGNSNSWVQDLVIDDLPPQKGVEPNWKPLVAATFAALLLAAGLWSSRLRFWRGRVSPQTLRRFATTALPFVLTEAATGLLSLSTGLLAIPPLLGPGTVVDVAILAAGLFVLVLRRHSPSQGRATHAGTHPHRQTLSPGRRSVSGAGRLVRVVLPLLLVLAPFMIFATPVAAAPVTTPTFGYPSDFPSAQNAFVSSETSIGFYVTDPSGSGIRNTSYRVDEGPWTNYTVPFSFAGRGEGDHVLDFYSEDFAGNREGVGRVFVRVDDTAPETKLAPAEGPYDADTRFTLTATDAGSGVGRTEYRVDGGLWRAYTVAFSLPGGDHALTFRSVDRVNNTEATRSFSLTVGGPGLPWLPQLALAAAGVIAVLFAGLEFLRRSFLLPFVLLWARLSSEGILDHERRGMLRGYLAASPGAHFAAIRADLRMAVGTLSYHLWVLEREGITKSWRDGRFRRYALSDYRISDIQPRLADIDLLLLQSIRGRPGLTQRDLMEELGVSQPTVSQHVTKIEKLGFVRATREGLRKRYLLNEDAIAHAAMPAGSTPRTDMGVRRGE